MPRSLRANVLKNKKVIARNADIAIDVQPKSAGPGVHWSGSFDVPSSPVVEVLLGSELELQSPGLSARCDVTSVMPVVPKDREGLMRVSFAGRGEPPAQ